MNIYTLKQIETPRLIIRPIQSGDEIALNTALNNSLTSLQPWMPWAKNTDFKTTHAFVHQAISNWRSTNNHVLPMVVINKTTQHIIGATGYNERSAPLKQYYEIGYWLDTQYEGQGLMTECVNALTRYTLENLNAQRVQLRIQVDNKKSIAVAQRCKFACEATLKNNNLDCVSGLPANSLMFACCDIDSLPPLAVTWQHTSTVTNQPVAVSPNSTNKNATSTSTLPIIKTKRLTLIPPREQDTDISYRALVNSLDEVAPRFSWAHKDLTLEQHRAHIREGKQTARDIRTHDHLFYYAWDTSEKNIFGEVWFKILDWSLPSMSMCYWFDTQHTGRGYASEAAIEMIEYAFNQLQAKRIQLEISVQNNKSLNLAKRLGFVHEGTLKNASKNFVTGEIMAIELFAMTDILQLQKFL